MESFDNGRLLSAADTAMAPPTRFLTLFFPNGVYPAAWQASESNGQLNLNGSLEPLQRFEKDAVVIQGMNNPLGGHLGQTSGFLSGVGFAPNKHGVIQGGTSLDQILARHWGKDTFIPSLNLALEPPSQGSFGDLPRSYGNSISWSSPTSKIEPQINPQQAFDQVFFGQTAAGREAAQRKKRIVDEIWGQAKSLESRISQFDRQKLGQYLDSISDLESKLNKASQPDQRPWSATAEFEASRPASSGIPASFQEHMKLMMEIMFLALQTNSTRVATLVMGHSISRVIYDFVDPSITRNHHDYSHHRNDPEKIDRYNQITTWFSSQCGAMLERMAAIDEGNGSLLDNSLVLFGSCMKDGNVHEPVDVPIALFGKAGGKLKTGRHIMCPKDSVLAQLHLSLLHLYGIDAQDFNSVTDRVLPGLL